MTNCLIRFSETKAQLRGGNNDNNNNNINDDEDDRQINRFLFVFVLSTGRIILSRDIETVAMAIANTKMPDVWLMNSYPTLKSLGSFVKDLQQRIAFFQVNTQRTIN